MDLVSSFFFFFIWDISLWRLWGLSHLPHLEFAPAWWFFGSFSRPECSSCTWVCTQKNKWNKKVYQGLLEKVILVRFQKNSGALCLWWERDLTSAHFWSKPAAAEVTWCLLHFPLLFLYFWEVPWNFSCLLILTNCRAVWETCHKTHLATEWLECFHVTCCILVHFTNSWCEKEQKEVKKNAAMFNFLPLVQKKWSTFSIDITRNNTKESNVWWSGVEGCYFLFYSFETINIRSVHILGTCVYSLHLHGTHRFPSQGLSPFLTLVAFTSFLLSFVS